MIYGYARVSTTGQSKDGNSLEAGCTESCDNFIDGFRLGARMMMDVLADSHS